MHLQDAPRGVLLAFEADFDEAVLLYDVVVVVVVVVTLNSRIGNTNILICKVCLMMTVKQNLDS